MNDRAKAYVRGLTVGRLATVGSDGRPHCVPVCFAVDGDRVLIMTAPGAKKVRNIRASGRAAIAIDNGQAIQGVMIQGPAQLVEDAESFLAAQDVMLAAGALARAREPGEQVVIEVTGEQWVSWGLE